MKARVAIVECRLHALSIVTDNARNSQTVDSAIIIENKFSSSSQNRSFEDDVTMLMLIKQFSTRTKTFDDQQKKKRVFFSSRFVRRFMHFDGY